MIDEEKVLTKIIQKKLKNLWYTVEIISSCKEFYNQPIKECDLFLIDVLFKDGCGIQIVKHIRNNPNNTTPVMMITGYSGIQYKTKALDSGADDYLVKPFSFDELTARIRSLLRRSQHIKEEGSLKYKNIEFNLTKREVIKWNFTITMTKKEKQIVEYFLYNKDKFISTDKLWNSVWWRSKHPVSKNTINVTIFKVRKKLWTDFHLETKVWEWYRLITGTL